MVLGSLLLLPDPGPPPLSRQAHAAPSPAHGTDVTRDTTMGSKATCSINGNPPLLSVSETVCRDIFDLPI